MSLRILNSDKNKPNVVHRQDRFNLECVQKTQNNGFPNHSLD